MQTEVATQNYCITTLDSDLFSIAMTCKNANHLNDGFLLSEMFELTNRFGFYVCAGVAADSIGIINSNVFVKANSENIDKEMPQETITIIFGEHVMVAKFADSLILFDDFVEYLFSNIVSNIISCYCLTTLLLYNNTILTNASLKNVAELINNKNLCIFVENVKKFCNRFLNKIVGNNLFIKKLENKNQECLHYKNFSLLFITDVNNIFGLLDGFSLMFVRTYLLLKRCVVQIPNKSKNTIYRQGAQAP